MQHLLARPVIDHGGAADRVRNHLRRRAITRVGRIEGDLYLLPYLRATGVGPEGEGTFHLLAAELGDPRIRLAHLPPADLAPFDATVLPAGARLMPATQRDDQVREAGEAIAWRPRSFEALVHYPFWLMRVEDCGRVEGAWIDAVEGRLIHHTIGSAAPLPSLRRCALLLAPPAALAALPALGGLPAAALAAGSAAAALAAGALVVLEGRRIDRRRSSGR